MNMNEYIHAVAIFYVGVSVADTILTPFVVGDPRGPYTAWHCLASMIGTAMLVPLCGRVLGWW